MSGWPAWADAAAVRQLRKIVRDGRVGHAYLVSGPRGVGKAALARAFAQAICCSRCDIQDRSLPCGACHTCRAVAKGVHPDVEVFSLESQAALADKSGLGSTLTIETIRRLRATAALLPMESERRVLLVEDAETLLEPAQQALLKTLEEPPSAVTIVLLADEPERLLETVRSRCQEVVVRPVSDSAVREALRVAGVDDALAEELAALSRGCPAWALRAAAEPKELKARRAEREAAQRWLAASPYERLVTAFKLGEQFGKRRADVIGTIQATVQALRDEMLRSAGIGGEAPIGVGVASFAPAASPAAFGRAIAASLRCLSDLESNVRPRLALEAMVMTWPKSEARPR
jgi:DNA polymerase-3 subunit delta'